MRSRTLVLLAILAIVIPVWLTGLVRGGGSTAPVRAAALATPPVSPQSRALAVLRRWDRQRAAAWRRADVPALARLYLPGSRAGRADVADLRRWRRRGLRVTGLRQQLASVRVVRQRRRRLVVLVTERTVGGIVVGLARRRLLPRSSWAVHRIVLVRSAAGWRVVEARAQPAR